MYRTKRLSNFSLFVIWANFFQIVWLRWRLGVKESYMCGLFIPQFMFIFFLLPRISTSWLDWLCTSASRFWSKTLFIFIHLVNRFISSVRSNHINILFIFYAGYLPRVPSS